MITISDKHLIFTDGGGFPREDKEFDGVGTYRIFKPDKVLLHADGIVAEKRTGQYGEINGMAEGLKNLYDYAVTAKLENQTVFLVTDSMLYMSTLTNWIHKWIKFSKGKGGTLYRAKNKPVKNQDKIMMAFSYMLKLQKERKIHVRFFHINSHVPKKDVKELHKVFQQFNKCEISLDDFLFLYLQNGLCDKAVTETYQKFIQNKK